MTNAELMTILDGIAPFDTQLGFDNSGLLVGSPAATVRGIHFALDCTPAVLDEMAEAGANVLITHHPLMFSAIRRIDPAGYEGGMLARLLREGWTLIALHTNLDAAPGGINDALARAIGLTNVTGEGFLRVGELPAAMDPAALAAHLTACLGDAVRTMGRGRGAIRRAAVSSGAGSDGWEQALALGAQAFITGEMKHHHALEAAAAGLVCYECGHRATEAPGIFALADALQNDPLVVKYRVHITKSVTGPYESPTT